MHRTRPLLVLMLVLIPLLLAAPATAAGGPADSGFIVVASAPSADFYASIQTGPPPLRVALYDRSEGTRPLRYLWDFGDGTVSGDKDPSHTFVRSGTYTVRLTVTNAYGEDTETRQDYIRVGDPPQADFSATPFAGLTPLTVTFTDHSGGSPSAWRWDFGDGSGSALQNPSHTYTRPGTYSVCLTATNGFGGGTVSRAALVTAGVLPTAEFIADPREGDSPLTVRFRDFSGGDPLAWNWEFGDGTAGTEQDPVHTYQQAGTYTTALRVTNRFGSDLLTRPGHIQVRGPADVQVTPEPATPAPPAEEPDRGSLISLIREARGVTEKDLPAAAVIPRRFMAPAAMLTSLFFVAVSVLSANIGLMAQAGPGLLKFFADLAGGHAVEKVSEAEIGRRGIVVQERERHILGFSAAEVIIIEVAVIMLALAFVLADRAALTLGTVLTYLLVGAVSVVLHDCAHRFVATRHGHEADTQFWGLGTVILFVTAWLYGNAFAQSYRSLVRRHGDGDIRQNGIEMLAGPIVSIVLMVLFLGLTRLGGSWAVAGGVGFTINLITAVYSLMPIGTMDGGAVWAWNRLVYLAFFLPMVAFYLFTYLIP